MSSKMDTSAGRKEAWEGLRALGIFDYPGERCFELERVTHTGIVRGRVRVTSTWDSDRGDMMIFIRGWSCRHDEPRGITSDEPNIKRHCWAGEKVAAEVVSKAAEVLRMVDEGRSSQPVWSR